MPCDISVVGGVVIAKTSGIITNEEHKHILSLIVSARCFDRAVRMYQRRIGVNRRFTAIRQLVYEPAPVPVDRPAHLPPGRTAR